MTHYLLHTERVEFRSEDWPPTAAEAESSYKSSVTAFIRADRPRSLGHRIADTTVYTEISMFAFKTFNCVNHRILVFTLILVFTPRQTMRGITPSKKCMPPQIHASPSK